MNRVIDMTGQKCGKLTVIKRILPSVHKHAMWLCKCKCGKEKVVSGIHLRAGHSQSCGCSRYDRMKLTSGLSAMRALITGYKQRAKSRRLDYNLTEEQFKKITQKDCYYCSVKPNNMANYLKCNGNYTYNGLDRVDNTKGYTLNNVVPCCKTCNSAKGILTLQEFKNWINKVYNNINKKGDEKR